MGFVVRSDMWLPQLIHFRLYSRSKTVSEQVPGVMGFGNKRRPSRCALSYKFRPIKRSSKLPVIPAKNLGKKRQSLYVKRPSRQFWDSGRSRGGGGTHCICSTTTGGGGLMSRLHCMKLRAEGEVDWTTGTSPKP